MRGRRGRFIGSGGYDAAALTWFAALPTPATSTEKNAVNTFIVGCKSDSNWALLDGFLLFALQTQANTFVDLKAPSRVATRPGSPTSVFTAGRGWAGSGALSGSQTDYIGTGFTPSSAGGNMTQNNSMIGTYNRSAGQNNTYPVGVNGSASNDFYYRPRTTGNTFTGTANGASVTFASSITDASGVCALCRTASNLTTAYIRGSSVGTETTASSGFANGEIRVLQVSGLAGTTDEIGALFYGAGNINVAALTTRINTLMAALGANV